jgi:hypothetical protein
VLYLRYKYLDWVSLFNSVGLVPARGQTILNKANHIEFLNKSKVYMHRDLYHFIPL